MGAEFLIGLGPWIWLIAGLLLLAAELLLSGVFLIWIGIAALITGVLSLFLWPFGFWSWQLQILLFAVLSFISILIGKSALKRREEKSDQPLLNQRTASMIGRTAVLSEAIVNGRGRIHIDDTTWIVNGPDLPQGTPVRITGGSGTSLTVGPL